MPASSAATRCSGIAPGERSAGPRPSARAASRLPERLVVDTKHHSLSAAQVLLPTTVARGRLLGASVGPSCSIKQLTAGNGEFSDEARAVAADYAPETVCADGWETTATAWRAAFPTVTIVLCFLHSVIKMRDKCRRNASVRSAVLDRAWAVYRQATRVQFSQLLRRLREWAEATLEPGSVRAVLLRACAKGPRFAFACAHPGLYAMRYFHGTIESARRSVRATAMLWNFRPHGARTRRTDQRRYSPFHDINGFQ